VALHICAIFDLDYRDLKENKQKTKITGAFAVCRHMTMRTKVFYRVLTHGKDATCQQSVDLGAIFWTKWSEK
jgi:hypothetical protein